MPGDAGDARSEWLEPTRDGAADRAVPEHQHEAAVESLDRLERRRPARAQRVDVALPDALDLEVEQRRQTPAQGEDHQHDPLRDADVVHAARGAHDDARAGRSAGAGPTPAKTLCTIASAGQLPRAAPAAGALSSTPSTSELDVVRGLADQFDTVRQRLELVPQRPIGDEDLQRVTAPAIAGAPYPLAADARRRRREGRAGVSGRLGPGTPRAPRVTPIAASARKP